MNYDLNYTFRKFKFLVDNICHGTDNDIGSDEVLSIFMSNFEGEEILQFREAQKDGRVARQ